MPELESQVRWVASGVQREGADNRATMVAQVAYEPSTTDFRRLFVGHYEAIRKTCLEFARPGVAVFAMDQIRSSLSASVCVASAIGRTKTAVIGRHAQADLYVPNDPMLSLRHLLLVVEPARSLRSMMGSEVRYRLLDLRTELGFRDEGGRRLESVAAEGPAFFVSGDYALLCLTTGDSTDFCADADEAWSMIPERVYVEEREGVSRWWAGRRRLARASSQPPVRGEGAGGVARRHRTTLVQTLPGVMVPGRDLLREGDERVGTLSISDGRRQQRLCVGESGLARGVLLGRYDRCDADETGVLEHNAISRVHAAALRVGDDVVLIDTASTNGTYDLDEVERAADWEQGRVRVTRMGTDKTYVFGEGLAWVKWRSR